MTERKKTVDEIIDESVEFLKERSLYFPNLHECSKCRFRYERDPVYLIPACPGCGTVDLPGGDVEE